MSGIHSIFLLFPTPFFTRKDGYGACTMYALSDYKVRNDASYEKDYLLGKYGATPIMDDLSKVLE